MAGAQLKNSYKRVSEESDILPVPRQYIFSLMNFIINNQEMFPTYSSIHNIKTRKKHHLHTSNANLTCFRK